MGTGSFAVAQVLGSMSRFIVMSRPLAVSQIVIGVCTGALMLTWRGQTALLFTSRALSMGSYAILYVYTPEVRDCTLLSHLALSVHQEVRITSRRSHFLILLGLHRHLLSVLAC